MRRLLALVALLPVGLLGVTDHNPGGLPQCSHAIYQSNAIDAEGGVIVDGPAADVVVTLTHAGVTEIKDSLSDWAFSAADTAASWTYSGTEDITVDVTWVVSGTWEWTPDGAESGGLQLFSAFKSEAAIDTASERTVMAAISPYPVLATATVPPNSTAVVKDTIDVDAADSIGMIYRHLTGLGYFAADLTSLSVEIQQVSPPCRN